MSVVYIAGPMTGYPEFNFPAFNQVAARLRDEGWEVINPAEKEEEMRLDEESLKTGDAELAMAGGFDFRSAYLWDLTSVINADAIYMLDGWDNSLGARGEHLVALNIQKHYPEYKILYERE